MGPFLVLRGVLPLEDQTVVVRYEMVTLLLIFDCDCIEIICDQLCLPGRDGIATEEAHSAAFTSLLRALFELVEHLEVFAVDDLLATQRRKVTMRQIFDFADIGRFQLAPAGPDMGFDTETENPFEGSDFVLVRHGDLLETPKTPCPLPGMKSPVGLTNEWLT